MNLASSIAAAVKDIPMPGTAYRETVVGRILLVDGDYAAYYHSGKDDTHWTKGRDEFLSRIAAARDATGSDLVEIHLSSPLCTKGDRYAIAFSKAYQSNRGGSSKPANWEAMREYLTNLSSPKVKTVVWEDREADDGVAYVSTEAAKNGRYHAIHTRDKDFRMFPGIHLDWTTFSTVEVPFGTFLKVGNNGKQFGHYWFWRQMLWGDGADAIPGCKGIGEKRSNEVLEGTVNNADAERVVKQLYKEKFGVHKWADVYVEQAALLWMRNDVDASLGGFLQIMDPTDGDVSEAFFRMRERVRKIKHGG